MNGSSTRSGTHALLASVMLAAPLLFAQTPEPVAAPVVAPVAAPVAAPAPPPAPPSVVIVSSFNPAEVGSAGGKLKMVMLMSDADRAVPGGGTKHLRFFQGWPFDRPLLKAPADPSKFSPGPTLRARVGDKVEIMFLNTVNDANFPRTDVQAEAENDPSAGCDHASNPAIYPARDRFPNCFHASSTANLHFHGTHTTPDALGDNVLEQVLPNKDATQEMWKATFQKIFDRAQPAESWRQLPSAYTDRQKQLVKARDEHLWMVNEQQIKAGQFPQYVVGAFPNVFEIPDYDKVPGRYVAGQSPGTQWYHAHKHGSTALHTLNGLAGAFIIEGGYDDFLRRFYGLGNTYAGTEFEKIFVLQFINPDLDLQRTRAQGPAALLINGMSQPAITMKPGEVQLWRFLNATVGSLGNGTVSLGPVPFKTPAFAFRQTALDGVQFSEPNYLARPFVDTPAGIVLASGNRADLLVRAPDTPGTTTFMLNDTAARPSTTTFFTVTVSNDQPLGKKFPCEVAAGEPVPGDCWAPLPKFLRDLPTPTNFPHHVTFGWDAEPGRTGAGRFTSSLGVNLPPKFTIDNKQFEEFGPTIDQCMPLDGLQEWVLENATTTQHPFHIHINPFQVTKVETPSVSAGVVTYAVTRSPTDAIWQDVISIPAGVALATGQVIPGRVTIRQHFADFAGTFVLHCHILAHEDRGMMQLVRIVPANHYPAGCQGTIPQHH